MIQELFSKMDQDSDGLVLSPHINNQVHVIVIVIVIIIVIVIVQH